MTPPARARRFRLYAATLAAAGGLLLAGCQATGGGQATTLGQSQNAVRASAGEPFAIYDTGAGSIWFYDTGARIMQRERLVFSANGELEQRGPAWGRAAFEQVDPATWTVQELLHHFGPPLRQENPRSSIFGELLGDAPAPSRPSADAAAARAVHWIYGFREYHRYYVITITVLADGHVDAITIAEDDASALS